MTKLERLGESGFYYESGTGEVCATDKKCMVWTYDGPTKGKAVRQGPHTECIERRETALAGLSFPWQFYDSDVFSFIKKMKMNMNVLYRSKVVLYYAGDGTALYSEGFNLHDEQVPDMSGRFVVQTGDAASFVVPAWYLKEFPPEGGLQYGDKAVKYETIYKRQRYTVVVMLITDEYIQHCERVLCWHEGMSCTDRRSERCSL